MTTDGGGLAGAPAGGAAAAGPGQLGADQLHLFGGAGHGPDDGRAAAGAAADPPAPGGAADVSLGAWAGHQLLLTVDVPGAARGQGSMRPLGRGRVIHPDATVLQRQRVTGEALRQWAPSRGVLTGPVGVRVWVIAERPRSHYLPANRRRPHPVLRPDVPAYSTSYPDLDKVQRLIGDALTDANVLKDDKVIARWEAVRLYGERASTHIELFDLQKGAS